MALALGLIWWSFGRFARCWRWNVIYPCYHFLPASIRYQQRRNGEIYLGQFHCIGVYVGRFWNLPPNQNGNLAMETKSNHCIIMVPLFLIILKKSMHSATALSLSIVPILSISALIKYISTTPAQQISSYQTGYLLWIMLIPMLLGVIFFSSLGQKLATKVPVVWLRVIFALLSAFILVKTLLELYS